MEGNFQLYPAKDLEDKCTPHNFNLLFLDINFRCSLNNYISLSGTDCNLKIRKFYTSSDMLSNPLELHYTAGHILKSMNPDTHYSRC